MNSQIIVKAAEQIGTPLYLYDRAALMERINYLREKFPQEMELCYAMKANSFLVGELVERVDRFEVCSPGEYDICCKAGIPMEKLVISGVYKAWEDTLRMVKDTPAIGWYTVESMQQLAELEKAAELEGRRLRVLLRLTSGNQFGLNREEIDAVIAAQESYPGLDIAGVQFFSGTQKKIRRIRKELAQLGKFLDELEERYGYIPREIEYGAGLPVEYFRESAAETAESAAEHLRMEKEAEDELLDCVAEEIRILAARSHVTMELGRNIAASCGTYVTRVVDRKKNDDQNYAILDGGIHHIAYYGQMMAMKVPYFQQIPEREGEKKEEWNLCGSLCTVNDLILKQLPVASLETGDLFAFERAGAYCAMEGISLFLSRALPAVAIVDEDGSARLLRGHEATYPLNYRSDCF